jgi:hypothetical protein
MVRNKDQSREGSTENRRSNQGDQLRTDKTTRGAPMQEDLRENTGRNKQQQGRKGSPGKLNDH